MPRKQKYLSSDLSWTCIARYFISDAIKMQCCVQGINNSTKENKRKGTKEVQVTLIQNVSISLSHHYKFVCVLQATRYNS